MKKLLTLSAVMLFGVSLASAGHVTCGVGAGSPGNVNIPAGFHCNLGPLLFGDFVAASNSGHTVGINPAPFTRWDAPTATAFINFEVAPQQQVGTVKLTYSVTGNQIGADLNLNTYSGNPSITETVCLTQPNQAGACPAGSAVNLFVQGAGPTTDQKFFQAAGKVWVSKDIQIVQGSTLSDFTNSHHVPEPVSLMLMGSGLIALGLLRRRKTAA